MAHYRKIDPRMWNDEKFRTLSTEGKLAFVLLLTHPHMTALGAMRATIPGLAAELGGKGFAEAFREVFAKGLAKHDEKASCVYLPRFLKYNKPESPNVVKAWAHSIDLIPECHLKSELIQEVKGFAEALPEAFGKALPEAFAKAMPNQEQEQEQEQQQERRKKNGAVAPVVQPEVPVSVPGLNEEVWYRWVAYRKSIGKPLRPVSFLSAAVDLAKHGANQAAVVEQSVAQGWQGLFPLKGDGKPTKDPRFSAARNFDNVDYHKGVNPDGSF